LRSLSALRRGLFGFRRRNRLFRGGLRRRHSLAWDGRLCAFGLLLFLRNLRLIAHLFQPVADQRQGRFDNVRPLGFGYFVLLVAGFRSGRIYR
jgi:hypothetical protein